MNITQVYESEIQPTTYLTEKLLQKGQISANKYFGINNYIGGTIWIFLRISEERIFVPTCIYFSSVHTVCIKYSYVL